MIIPDFGGGFEDDAPHGLAVADPTIFCESPKDVLHYDDRAIDDDPEIHRTE